MKPSSPEKAAPRAAFVMEQHIGHQTYYQNLRRIVDAAGCEGKVLDARWIEITYTKPGDPIERLPLLSPSLRGTIIGSLQAIRGLRAPYDVAFFNTQVPAMLAGGFLHRKPYVLSVDITPIQYDSMAEHYGHRLDRNPVLRALKKRLNRALFARASRILPWSHWAAESLKTDYGAPPERIEVLPPGIDLECWRPGPAIQERGPVRILFVGGDLYRKGGHILIDAFRRLPPGIAELVLVTRTPLPPETEPGIFVYNHMTPNSPELVALYQSAGVFVLPTLAEALGIAAIEASAAGLPVVASRVGGLTDVVDEGQTGYLAPPGDTAALADRLHRLAASPDLRRQMGQAARERAERYFDARKNARRIIEILMENALTKP